MNVQLILLVGFVFLCIQISVFRVLPEWLKNIMTCIPILGFLINLGGSALITMFTGVASLVGLSNLLASVFFGVYIYAYKIVRDPHVTGYKWIFPVLDTNRPKTFIF